jgi:hypothetical protein
MHLRLHLHLSPSALALAPTVGRTSSRSERWPANKSIRQTTS